MDIIIIYYINLKSFILFFYILISFFFKSINLYSLEQYLISSKGFLFLATLTKHHVVLFYLLIIQFYTLIYGISYYKSCSYFEISFIAFKLWLLQFQLRLDFTIPHHNHLCPHLQNNI